MVEAIHKHPLSLDVTKVELPVGSKVLYFGVDPMGVLCLWAQCEPSRPKVSRRFHVVGTGQQVIHTAMEYIGSAKVDVYMWHLFEDRS